jgi:chorismate mutase
VTNSQDTEVLFKKQREKISSLNDQIIALLAERQQVCLDVGRIKAKHNIAVRQPERVQAVLDQCVKSAEPLGLRSQFVRWLFQQIIAEACALEEQLCTQGDTPFTSVTPFTLVTLGPSGTNHEWIANEYLRETGQQAQVLLVETFTAALEAWHTQRAQRILICSAHPEYPRLIAACVTENRLKPIGSFIRGSQLLAVLTSSSVGNPQSIAIHPATREYTDLSSWESVIEVQSTVAAVQGIISGKWHSAIGPLTSAKQYSELRVDRELGAPEDVWVILG